MTGGSPHGSRGEFTTDKAIEREADAFAAALLMPRPIFGRMVNRQPLHLAQVERCAEMFQTSLVSTAIRSVQLSDFPCAVVSLRAGQLSWGFLSASLREGGCYAVHKGALRSSTALEAWGDFAGGSGIRTSSFASSRSWFQTFDRAYLQDLTVQEEFLPVPVMNTLLVLLSIREQDLYPSLR